MALLAGCPKSAIFASIGNAALSSTTDSTTAIVGGI